MNKMYRQGDVLILKVSDKQLSDLGDEVPKKSSELGPTLALGEVTGHHHTVVDHPESYSPERDLPDYDPADFDYSIRGWAKHVLKDVGRTARKDPAAKLYQRGGEEGDRHLVVSRFTILRHEEHPAIPLEPGTYKIIQQKEFSPEGWKKVQD